MRWTCAVLRSVLLGCRWFLELLYLFCLGLAPHKPNACFWHVTLRLRAPPRAPMSQFWSPQRGLRCIAGKRLLLSVGEVLTLLQHRSGGVADCGHAARPGVLTA